MSYNNIEFWYQYDQNLNVHYMKRYINIVNSILNKGNRNLDYKEKHHIIPKSIDTRFDNKEYLIELSAREHFILHMILSKCFTNELKFKMEYAFVMMVVNSKYMQRDFKITSRVYNKCKVLNSEAAKARMSDPEIRKQISERQSKLMREKFNGGTFFDSAGIEAHNKGKISITDGVKNKYISKNEEIPDGWYVGNVQSKKDEQWHENLKKAWAENKENRTGKNHPMYGKGDLLKGAKNGRYGKPLKYINNGIKNKMVPPDKVEEFINNGWVLGKLKVKR